MQNFGDIHFTQVKFPDFSQFRVKIPWLFPISRNSLTFPWHFASATKFPDFSRFPEIPGPLATLLMKSLLWWWEITVLLTWQTGESMDYHCIFTTKQHEKLFLSTLCWYLCTLESNTCIGLAVRYLVYLGTSLKNNNNNNLH